MFKFFSLLGIFFFQLSLIAQTNENFNMVVRSHLSFGSKTSANIWGYVDNEGKEYALMGTSTGLEIIDVTDPDNVTLLFSVPSVNNFWREVRTHEHYAYVTTEGANAGLLIVNLIDLPNSIETKIYRGNGPINNQLRTIHTVHIEDGYAYCYGSNIQQGGVIILSLADPWNPVFVGQYGAKYIHDGIVRNDTIWAAHIFEGTFAAIDVTDKANPQVLVSQETPGNFTHNTWLNDAGNVLLTTDEIDNSFLTSYRVDDLNNITELDRFQTAPGSNSVVHNTYLKNDFAFTSWYTEGVVIVDAFRPENLVEVAKYDISVFEGGGFKGCWGVYPYFPSGNIVASDIETGLWVLTPTLMRAAYLEGIISDSLCEIPLEKAKVEIVELGISTMTDINGRFKTGTPYAGTYTVKISRDGYDTLTLENVTLIAEQVYTVDRGILSNNIIQLNGFVNNDNVAISNAFIRVSDNNISYNFVSDEVGEFSRCNVLPGDYDYIAGKWGYITECEEGVSFDEINTLLDIPLEKGIYDDFSFNFGWTVESTATVGFWERGIPVGTTFIFVPSNPGADVEGDCGEHAFVTGNGGGQPGFDDVDDGYTKLISPVFDLSGYENPYVSYYYWFFNAGGSTPVDDYLRIKISNGVDAVLVDSITSTSGPMSQWVKSEFKIRDLIEPTATMQMTFEAADLPPNGHLVEAGLDFFVVYDSIVNTVAIEKIQTSDIKLYPVPAQNLVNIDLSVFNKSQFPVHIQLFDQQGALIERKQLNEYTEIYPMRLHVKSGLYFIHTTTKDKQVFTKKLPIIID